MSRPTRRRAMAGGAPDAGSGTVLVLGLVAAVIVLALGSVLVAGGYLARSRAQTAADLAALAGAAALAVPPGVEVSEAAARRADPCGRVQETASRNGARVTACTQHPRGVVRVVVEVAAPVAGTVAEAVAGPAWAREGG